MSTFESPDEFVAGVSQMPFEGVPEGSRFIVDGNQIAHAFTWKMTAPMKVDVPMCEILEVEGNLIRSSELYYDSRLFAEPS